MCCIYIITNMLNNKIYIGKTKDFKRRYKEYKYKSRNLNKHSKYLIMEEINKYGFENFKMDVLEECDIDKLNDREIFWINTLNSKDPEIGYNSKDGGLGGKLNQTSKDKMSVSSKKFKHSEETKLKKSKPIFVVQNNNVFLFQSAKIYGDLIHKDRSEVTSSIKRGIKINNSYVFYQDKNDRKSTMIKIYNKKCYGCKRALESLSDYLLAYSIVESYVKCRD